jgi:hypothetical protein
MIWIILIILILLFILWAFLNSASVADDEMEIMFPQTKPPKLPRDN